MRQTAADHLSITFSALPAAPSGSARVRRTTVRRLRLRGKVPGGREPERIVHDLGDGRVMTMVFDDVGGKTKLMLTIEMAESEEAERTGWGQILDNFGKHLATLSGRQK